MAMVVQWPVSIDVASGRTSRTATRCRFQWPKALVPWRYGLLSWPAELHRPSFPPSCGRCPMPVVVLPDTSIVSLRCLLNEIKNFSRGCARAKNSPNTDLVERRSVFLGNDASAEDDDIVKTRFNQFFAHLREEVGVGSREGREPEEPCIFVPYGVDDLLRSPAQSRVNDLMASIPKGRMTTLAPRSCPSRPAWLPRCAKVGP